MSAASPSSATPIPISRKRVPSSLLRQADRARRGRCGRRDWSVRRAGRFACADGNRRSSASAPRAARKDLRASAVRRRARKALSTPEADPRRPSDPRRRSSRRKCSSPFAPAIQCGCLFRGRAARAAIRCCRSASRGSFRRAVCRSEMRVSPSRREAILRRFADAPDDRHRLRGEEGKRLGTADHGKTARLVEVGGDLGEEFVVAQPDGGGDADLAAPRRRWKRASVTAGGAACSALGAGKVEEGLVDRKRLDGGRQRQHQFAHLAPDARVFRHVGRDHRRRRGRRRAP